jgi:glycine betaine/choline ABC-type transport system substrate-binding protein
MTLIEDSRISKPHAATGETEGRTRYPWTLPKSYSNLGLHLGVALWLLAAGCGKSKAPIVVGSSSGTEQLLLGEIIAQHLEHSVQRKVERRFGLGGELITFQALSAGEITLYPDYTGSIEIGILKETPASDRDIILERTRRELLRTAQLDVLDPLGYDNPPAMVVRTSDADTGKIKTLSDAAAGAERWKLGVSYEFQQRGDAQPVINSYKLPLARGMQGMAAARLFPALQSGELNMLAVSATDGNLDSPEFRVLTDDKQVLPPYIACLLVRHNAIVDEPQLRPALTQLSGKFTSDAVRKMNAEVDLKHRDPAGVAAEFLASVGLK